MLPAPPHPLETILRSKLAFDTRPDSARNKFQVGAGRKRTTLVGASVKSITETNVANAGITTWGVLKQQPMTRAMFKQRNLSDCFLLATCIALTIDDPNWTDNIILPIDAKNVIVQYYYGGMIVQITCTLEVSTSYNNPDDDDVRGELIEKTYGFLRSGIADYTKDNFGTGTEAGMALGWVPSGAYQSKTNDAPAFIDAARAAGHIVTIITPTTATVLPAQHCECAINGHTLVNPWDGSVDVPVTQATLQNTSEVAVIYSLSKPSPPILVRPPVTLPSPMLIAVPIAPTLTEPTMPAPTAKITKLNRDTAAWWDGIVVNFTATGGAPTVVVSPAPPKPPVTNAATGEITFPMGTADCVVTLTVTAPDGTTAVDQASVKFLPPSIPTPTPTPIDDPIVSVVVTTTRKSGKVTNTVAG